jgi:integrase
VIGLAYGSGLRRSEILHLTWADIDLENQRIRVNAKKGTEDILEWDPKVAGIALYQCLMRVLNSWLTSKLRL